MAVSIAATVLLCLCAIVPPCLAPEKTETAKQVPARFGKLVELHLNIHGGPAVGLYEPEDDNLVTNSSAKHDTAQHGTALHITAHHITSCIGHFGPGSAGRGCCRFSLCLKTMQGLVHYSCLGNETEKKLAQGPFWPYGCHGLMRPMYTSSAYRRRLGCSDRARANAMDTIVTRTEALRCWVCRLTPDDNDPFKDLLFLCCR